MHWISSVKVASNVLFGLSIGRVGRMRANTQVRLLNSLVGLAGLVNSELVGSLRATEWMMREPYAILYRHRIEVLREIALRLRELSVLPPFQANATVLCQVNIFSNNLHYSTLEFLTTARMPRVRGSKYLDRKRKAAIALEVKVPEDIEVHCCGKWRQDWRFFVKDLRQLSSCYARRICKPSRKYG